MAYCPMLAHYFVASFIVLVSVQPPTRIPPLCGIYLGVCPRWVLLWYGTMDNLIYVPVDIYSHD